MSETTPTPKKRSRLRKLGLVAGIFFVLLLVSYFVVTSGAFFKGVILPKVAKAMNAEVTVSEASIRPFSQVVLRDFKVKATGTEPLVTASEIRARYSLFAILGGNIKVEEVTLISPVVQIIQNADGTSNLDPILKSQPTDGKKAEPSSNAKVPQIDIKKVALNNAAVRITKNHAGGTGDVTELSNVNVTLDDLKNAQTGKLNLSAEIKTEQNPPAPGTNASLQATLAGNFTFNLSADLNPGAVKGNAKFDVTKAGGAFAELASFAASLDCDASPVEIKQLALRFQKAGANLGELRVSGPFDAAKSEGRLKMEILNIDKQVLNLAGAPSGLDFGPTTIRSTNQIDLAQSGNVITVLGQLEIARFSVTQNGQATPTLDLQATYNVTANTRDKTALIQTFTIDGIQNQRPLLLARLASPMNLAWGATASAAGDSTLDLTLTNLNLADWKPFTGDTASTGTVDAMLNLISKQGGKQLALIGNFSLTNFTGPSLGDKKLVSISINTTSATTINGADNISLQSDLAISKLILSDPRNSFPTTPLNVQFQLDATMRKQVFDLRKAQLSLTPTARATNIALVTGQVDMSRTNAIQGALKLAAESLDLTPYYDLFADKPQTAATTTATTPAPTPPASSGPGAEPAPLTLPFQNFTADLNITRFYLREVAMTNWQTGVKLDGSRVTLNPCQFTLNGAPVQANAALNFGIPGYEYDITFSADRIPVEPLANSFSPDYRGQAKGELLASAQIKGAGTSDANLQKNLTGHLDFTFTNANIQLVGPKAKRLITPIALALRIPELNQSPINWLNTAVKIGAGKINVSQFNLVSGAFTADTAGEIPMAAVLTNSPLNNLPVNFSLRRSLAASAHLIPDGTPTNATYVKLPSFIKLQGTLGAPEAQTDKLVIAGLLAQSISGIPGLGGEKGGRVLQNVGDLLTGGKSSSTNKSASTNKADANPLAKPGLLDFLNKPKK